MALGLRPKEIIEKRNYPLLDKKATWDRVEIREIAKVQNGYAFKSTLFNSEKGIPIVRIRDVERDFTETYYSGEFSDDYVLKNGDLLVGMDGDFKCNLWKGGKALLNQRVCRIIPDSKRFNKKFLYFVLQPYLDAINKETSSVTVKHLSSYTILEIPIPFPPLTEQHRIVEKIEELFSELDNGIENLKKSKEQIKTYRQAVLKSAFEGKLTESETADVKRENDELPEGWEWVKLEKVVELLQYGTSEKATGDENGIPVLRMGNIQDGKLDYSKLKFFHTEFDEKEKFMLNDGDLLFNRTNSAELVGKSAIFKNHHPKSIFASYLIRVKVKKNIYSSDFLNYFINSIFGRLYIKSVVSQNVGQANVNGTKLKNMDVPLLSLNKQIQIVEEIDRRFSVADKMEAAINVSLKKAEALRQSILKQAFEGKLV